MKIRNIDFLKKLVLPFIVLTFCLVEVNSKDRLILKQKNGPQIVLDLDKLLMIRFLNLTSVEEMYSSEYEKKIKIYPNPTKDKLVLKLENLAQIKSNTLEISIYNSNFQLVRAMNYYISEEIEINLKDMNLPKGIYILNIIDNNQLIKKSKFILE